MSRKILILITIIVTFLATKGLALEVRPQDASGYPGETVTVSINVTGASEAIDALGMDLVYAPACLSFESLSKTALTANYYMLAPNELGSGRLRIGGFGVVDSFSDSGILVNLNFKIREGASGDCEISLLDFVADLKGATTNPAKVTIYSVPSPPSNLRTASISSDKIELAWNDNSLNETGFILERKTEGGTYLQIAEVSTNVPTFSDTDVNPNTRYYYRVKACSNSACSSYSNEISPAAPTQDATPPLSFNLLLPENDSWTNDSSPTFAWGSSDDLESVLDGYFLYLDEALDTSLPPTTVSTKPSAPLSDGYYIWKVQAKNGQGLTTSSDTSLVKIDISKPVTTLAVSPLEYDSGPVRYIAPTATISLFSNDTGSGVLQTNYRIDHKGNWKSYASAITILEEGEHTLSYLSVDTAGNREDTATPIFFIDQTPPLTSDDAPSGWRSDAVTVNLISNDTGCGAASTYYAINQQSFTSGSRVDIDSSGTYSIRYYSIDNLGNKEDTKTAAYEIKIDTSPPNGTPLAPLEKGEYSTSDTIEFVLSFEDISDLESGISSYLVEVSTAEGDSQEIEVSGTSLVVSSCEEGKTYYARVKARNRAGLYGNYSDTSDGITIDTVWPSLLNGYFDARDKQVVLHFSERVTDPIGSQIKVNGVPLTGQEDINETAGGKTLTISVNKADSIELDENSLKDIAGNPIGKTRRSLYLLAGAGEEADLKVAIENRSGQALAFRCQDEGQIGDTLGQMIEQADEKAKTDPKISRMLETAYQIEAITPQGEDCGENLGGLILLEIPYEEEDDINLRAYRLNEESSQWELIEDGEINEPDGSKKVVRVEVDHLSLFSLGIARQANPDLTGAKAYPNPFIPGNATTYGASGITFDKLTEDAEIKIFTIAGELVKTLRAKYGEAVWETVNENGREVASGIYIYLITDSQDGKKTGKIAIIR